jgi:adenylylsulfate kinase
MESNVRSIAKAVSYRVLGSAATALIFYILSRKVGISQSNAISLSLGGGLLDGVLKIGLYFVHERIWNHIDFGRPKPPEYEI